MAKKLGELFAEGRGAPLDVAGQRVTMTYELPDPADGQTLRIAFTGARRDRREGLVVKARGGVLEVNGQRLAEVVLWTDTAPPLVELTVRRSGRGGLLVRMWNTWVDDAGVDQAWVGNAGIVVEETGDGAVLRCSDGYDDPSFDDLVVTVAR
ncbi:hypothetical protein [Nocardia sp. NRRL S-836]|uniref:hypothetical protein n=1 Tax=Nocardia sp. NRRL S-836 TaxID=1519492 RepID=UPI0006AEB96D|nr:hypothetical protein [Nocardia sp. NRRL S-836]